MCMCVFFALIESVTYPALKVLSVQKIVVKANNSEHVVVQQSVVALCINNVATSHIDVARFSNVTAS